jgi:signal transduction histidine kinase
VAASMSGIRILSQVARNQFAGKSPEAVSLLEQISLNASAILDSISDLIWAVKPHPDYLNDMADRMREYAVKIFDAKDIEYRLSIPRNLPMRDMDIETRRNIYLIFKEAVNNAMKYSSCTHMEVNLQVNNEQLLLRVADNGVGFDAGTTIRGNGLANMEKRARDIGGALSVISGSGKGTEVLLSLRLF